MWDSIHSLNANLRVSSRGLYAYIIWHDYNRIILIRLGSITLIILYLHIHMILISFHLFSHYSIIVIIFHYAHTEVDDEQETCVLFNNLFHIKLVDDKKCRKMRTINNTLEDKMLQMHSEIIFKERRCKVVNSSQTLNYTFDGDDKIHPLFDGSNFDFDLVTIRLVEENKCFKLWTPTNVSFLMK